MGRLDFNLAAFPTRLPRVEILSNRSPHVRFGTFSLSSHSGLSSRRFHSPPCLSSTRFPLLVGGRRESEEVPSEKD